MILRVYLSLDKSGMLNCELFRFVEMLQFPPWSQLLPNGVGTCFVMIKRKRACMCVDMYSHTFSAGFGGGSGGGPTAQSRKETSWRRRSFCTLIDVIHMHTADHRHVHVHRVHYIVSPQNIRENDQ